MRAGRTAAEARGEGRGARRERVEEDVQSFRTRATTAVAPRTRRYTRATEVVARGARVAAERRGESNHSQGSAE